MKLIISKATLAIAALLSVCSCTEDMEWKDSSVTPVSAIYEPSDGKSVELQSSATASLFFEWESAKGEDGGAPLYEVLFDRPGGDFSTPVYKVLSDGNGVRNYATISHKTLNSIGAKVGLDGGATGDLIWSVVASRGITTSPVVGYRTLTITRLLGFAEIPTSVYITGDATEGGSDLNKAMPCLSPETDVFSIYTYLKGGKGWKLVSSTDGNGSIFHIDGSKILEGDGECIADEDGVYRITMDFAIASVTMKKIDKVEFFYCAENKTLFELPYQGNGLFAGVGAVNFKVESWGPESRYKLQMTYGDGSVTHWGADAGIDGTPGAAGEGDPYFRAYETPISQWDNKWKLNNDLDGKSIKASLRFDLLQPMHFVELAEGSSTPDPGTETATPAVVFVSGEAVEGGNIECTKLDESHFQFFARLTGGKTFAVKDGAGKQYGTDLKVGAGNFDVTEDGVYRVTFDFGSGEYAIEKVTKLSVFDCWHDHGSAVLDLDYIGNGQWETTGVAFDSKKNDDDRYKFIMEVGGKSQQYGAVGGNREKAPSGSNLGADYFYLKAVNADQWNDSFKFEQSQKDKSLKIKVTLRGTYTHSVSE